MAKRKKSNHKGSSEPMPARPTSNAAALGNPSPEEEQQQQLAMECLQKGENDKAEAIYKDLLNKGLVRAQYLGNLGAICGMTGRKQEMKELLGQALSLEPNYPDALSNLANLHKEEGKLEEAVDLYRKALALDPRHAGAHGNLGNALRELGRMDEAIDSYRKAVEHNPDYWPGLNNLGLAIKDRGDLEGAIQYYEKALSLKSDSAEVLNNLGVAYADRGDMEKSKEMYLKAISINPEYAEAHNNLGHTLMAVGDYAMGWKTFGWRWLKKNPTVPHAWPKAERWVEGRVLKPGDRVMVVSEQGLGDTLQFMRYAITLRSLGVQVSVCAQHKLHGLIQESGIDPNPLAPPQGAAVEEGLWIAMMSLPGRLGVSPQQPIHTDPYIKTTSHRIEKWRDILRNEPRPIIGINWQGNPNQEKSNSMGRSLPLEAFAPIAATGIGSLLSLQKGHGIEQMDQCMFKDRFISKQSEVDSTWDFLETAAIIANCDIVITSDTAVAHLAGGMGHPTWLLLKHTPEWRWGLHGDSTFWYPSMRLFRQPRRGDWASVINQVCVALREAHSAKSHHNSSLDKNREQTRVHIKAPVSLGELIDKITILEIKAENVDGEALSHVRHELEVLRAILASQDINISSRLVAGLKQVNEELWGVEDSIRDLEHQKRFDSEFIELARSVYLKNDLRAAIKKQINVEYGSEIVEEKAYRQY